MIETRLMAPGTFTVGLVEDCPEWVHEITGRYLAAVHVFNGTVSHPERATMADLLAGAWYTGIHTGRGKHRGTLTGYGQAWLLKLARARQDQTVSKRPLYDGSNTSWLWNNVLRLNQGEGNGLTVGAATASSATPKKSGKVAAGQEPLEILGDVCRRFGVEWTCDRGVVNVAARASLFETTPSCMAVPVEGGDDVNLDGLEAVEFDERDDVDDYASTVVVPFTPDDFAYGVAYEVGDTVVATSGVFYECNSAHTSSGSNQPPGAKWDAVDPYGEATVGSTLFRDPFGGAAITARRVVTARNATQFGDAGDIAAAQLGKHDLAARAVTLDAETFALQRLSGQGTGKVAVGDSLYVFSPDDELVDLSAQVPFRGRRLPAATVRVQAARTNVDAGMSVVVRSWDGSGLVTDDVSGWVDFEAVGSSLEVGEPRRRRPSTVVSV